MLWRNLGNVRGIFLNIADGFFYSGKKKIFNFWTYIFFFSLDLHYLVANQDIKNPLWHFLELIVI